MKKAFTLIELILVILILAILSSLAIGFTSFKKEETNLLKLKMDYELLSSALALMRSQTKQKGLDYIQSLDEASFNSEKQRLFYCDNCDYSLLEKPIYSSFKAWIKTGKNEYKFYLNSKESLNFTYDFKEGIFECFGSSKCKDLL